MFKFGNKLANGATVIQKRGDIIEIRIVPDTEELTKEVKKLREIIRYWSYCTRQGMLKECPEKKDELYSTFRELNMHEYRLWK